VVRVARGGNIQVALALSQNTVAHSGVTAPTNPVVLGWLDDTHQGVATRKRVFLSPFRPLGVEINTYEYLLCIIPSKPNDPNYMSRLLIVVSLAIYPIWFWSVSTSVLPLSDPRSTPIMPSLQSYGGSISAYYYTYYYS
jgi:hypothetical protein